MSLSEKIRTHYDQARANPRQITVPEWDVTFYVYPLTVQQMGAIAAEDNLGRRLARALICRAKTEDGKPAFTEDDFLSLVTRGTGPYGPEVLARVVGEINADDPQTEEYHG